MPQLSLHSPVGDLTVSEEGGAIVAIDWGWGRDQTPTPLLKRAVKQLNAYFDGKRKTFDLPLAPCGSRFQHRVWTRIMEIPFGKTRTYGDLATRLRVAPRAVGAACGANPIPIIIPCHRVTAADGFGGYSGEGGLDTKVGLLKLEDAAIASQYLPELPHG